MSDIVRPDLHRIGHLDRRLKNIYFKAWKRVSGGYLKKLDAFISYRKVMLHGSFKLFIQEKYFKGWKLRFFAIYNYLKKPFEKFLSNFCYHRKIKDLDFHSCVFFQLSSLKWNTLRQLCIWQNHSGFVLKVDFPWRTILSETETTPRGITFY